MRTIYRILAAISAARALRNGAYAQHTIRRAAHRELARELRRLLR